MKKEVYMNEMPKNIFHPLTENWFTENIGEPTDVQRSAWPAIAAGSHVLVSAPTGSGKTMTAFLWALDRLITGAWKKGQVRILYVSPLKALNNDIQKNLLYPLGGLRDLFIREGHEFPEIQVMTRSGDTPQQERRKMLKHPPEILITTPESLNLMLTAASSREILRGVATVILDEVHAMAGTRRGTHLMTAVERLVELSGEFQRIALSATARPLETVARFVGGRTRSDTGSEPLFRERKVEIIESRGDKKYNITVDFPEDARETMKDKSWWPGLVTSFKKIIEGNRSTLFFGNSRRMVEKVTRFINEGEPLDRAYAHHGSLSKEVRLLVEEKLKGGDLEAIVATSSLELGIDIGDLDAVVCIQAPGSASAAIQRFGRAGHGVGETSRGYLFPTHGRDFVNAAVIARMVIENDIEELHPPEAPLDILAQVILSMVVAEPRHPDDIFNALRCSYPYRALTREHFDLVLQMLEGRYADSRIRELKARIHYDRVKKEVRALDNARYHLYLSGGTIPNRGYFDLKTGDTKMKIGELDEEFVWERSIGESFSLGSRTWKITGITHNDVEVEPVKARPGIIPFWRAGELNRSFHFSEKIGVFLSEAENSLENEAFSKRLKAHYFMEEAAADEMIHFLKRQKEVTKAELPHRHHLLVEHYDDPLNRSDSKQVLLHTLWGGRINGPFALALAEKWERQHGYRLEVMYSNDAVLLMLPHDFSSEDIFNLLRNESIEALLRTRLEKTGIFGASFRENAGRALLLPPGGFRKRMPLWLNRLRAKKLLEAVSGYEDFPILLETWRTCLRDEYDLENLKMLLDEIYDGEIRVTECVTETASPFAGDMIFQQTNKYMYEDDTPRGESTSGLRDDLIRDVALSSHLRPKIPDAFIDALNARLQRTAPGYAPSSAEELVQWCRERLLIPEDQWHDLTAAVSRDASGDDEAGEVFTDAAQEDLVMMRLPGASIDGVAAKSEVARICRALGIRGEDIDILPMGKDPGDISPWLQVDEGFEPRENEADEAIIQWLYCYGPVSPGYISRLWGIAVDELSDLLLRLKREDRVIIDLLREESDIEEVCEQQNLESLLRVMRRDKREELPLYNIEELQMFLALFSGTGRDGGDLDGLKDILEQFFGYAARAGAWEGHIFPARMKPYFTPWLDSLMQTSSLSWYGCGPGRVTFAFPEDRELFMSAVKEDEKEEKTEESLITGRGLYSFFDIAAAAKLNTSMVTERLWEEAWQGRVASDSFDMVRRGVLHGFKAADTAGEKSASARSAAGRWKSSRPMQGNWYALERPSAPDDLLEAEELNRERVRLLLRRYGILFRRLLDREEEPLRWKNIFRTLRIMELSGEILGGYFFTGIPGLQFISHEGLRFLRNRMDEEAVYWINATDPVSLSGIKLEEAKGRYPGRMPGNWMVFQGSSLVFSARKNFKELSVSVEPKNLDPVRHFGVFNDLLEASFDPMKHITVEVINDLPAADSPYREVFRKFGFRSEYKKLKLWRSY